MFPDDGYFPRGRSVLRRVQDEKVVGLLYGQRALCIGALKPLNYVGTSEHTHNKLTPFKRLAHTGLMFERVMLGSRADADLALNAVAGMHKRVVGELSDDAGERYPAGTPYSALDPELMWWTVAVMEDSALWFYEHLVTPLSPAERESFHADYVRFAELFGMPRDAAPPTYGDFRTWLDAELASDRVFLTDEARYMGYASAFEIPMPASRQLGKRGHDALVLYSLPERVRALYGLTLSTAAERFARAVVALHPRVRRTLPDRFAVGSCVPEFDMVAATEARRIARGDYTPQLREDLVTRAAAKRPRAAA
jgi:uncharacterized protein (DUF2236 family)